MTETILSIIVALFGGANILQFLFFRSTRRKVQAEALEAQTDAKQKAVDLHQDQYDYVSTQLSSLQEQYYSLTQKYRETLIAHLAEVDEKCEQIAALQKTATRLKQISCTNHECKERQVSDFEPIK